jgi:hypothetical protein
MKILSVTYRKNAQIRPFEHQHVEATASVGSREDPEEVLEKLKGWVDGQLYDMVEVVTVRQERKVRE